MQKIKSLFEREWKGDRLVYDQVVPGSEWVQAGEGVATRKWDGTSCLLQSGTFYKRYDAKQGKTPPAGFIPAQEPDPLTKHWPGWLPVSRDNPSDQWHREALANCDSFSSPLPDGTYELVGPKIQGNAEGLDKHYLVKHGDETIGVVPTDFESLKAFLKDFPGEGIVWHHPDGRMVKAKRRDFWK